MAHHDTGLSQPGIAEQPPKVKKPYVRVMTEKRREQNRRAQKLYREKLRQRIEELKEKGAANDAKSPDPVEEKPRSPPTPKDERKRSSILPAGPVVIDFNEIFQANGDIPVPNQGSILDLLPAPTPPTPPTFATTLPQHNKPILTSNDSQTTTTPNHLSNYWPMPPTSPTEPYIPPPTDPLTPSYKPYHGGALTTISRPCAYTRQRHLYEASPFFLFSTVTTVTANSHLPSPYLNHLHITCESTLSASLSIALSLGISRTQYLDDHPSPFPANFNCVSAALQPLPVVIDFLRDEHARTLAPALRPGMSQYVHPHPSYLDCIVFAKVRERAVRASGEGLLDHVEFFLDLMHGGLVCWGGGSPGGGGVWNKRGGGKRGRGDAPPRGAGGQADVAWNTRSWEARRWFLEKWKWLIGGEEEEVREKEMGEGEGVGGGVGVWEASRWWWGVRGEEWFGDDVREGQEWAQGLRQEGWEGADKFSSVLEEMKRTYVPLSGGRLEVGNV